MLNTLLLVAITALISIVLTSAISSWVFWRRVMKPPGSQEFRASYMKRDSVLNPGELKYHSLLLPHLETAGLILLPSTGLTQIATVKRDLPPDESMQAFDNLEGRTVQYLLAESKKLTPLAVVHIGGDGSGGEALRKKFPGLEGGALFCSAVFENIGIPEIAVYDKDMSDPARVVSRLQEIVRSGKTGNIPV